MSGLTLMRCLTGWTDNWWKSLWGRYTDRACNSYQHRYLNHRKKNCQRGHTKVYLNQHHGKSGNSGNTLYNSKLYA